SRRKLLPLLLRRRLQLPLGPDATLKETLEAIACRELGFPDETSLKSVMNRVLSRRLDADEPLPSAVLERELPKVELEALRGDVESMRAALLHDWIVNAPKRAAQLAASERSRGAFVAPPDPFDLTAFAHTVTAAARNSKTGRFGDHRVFINHVYDALRDERAFEDMTLAAFKNRLVEAATAKLIRFARADAVQTMNERDVRDSMTDYDGDAFHFLLLEKDAR
ncbi:MAG: hypothetical protein ACRC1K_02890, partial [Planctomycetia bacterium]